MDYSFFDFLRLIGSLALFLYGMKIMSEGLQKFAGDSLRRILTAMTTNRVTGMLTGVLITALIQSSSATTVMVVSFVNAGLLTLTQSIGVIMGANIGTTVTAWLISALGFKVDIAAFALPLLAFALPLFFSGKSSRKSIGEFVFGFAFLFMGLQSLKANAPDLGANPEMLAFVQNYTDMGFFSIILFLFIGAILTMIVQASAATMAITLIMCANGWISLDRLPFGSRFGIRRKYRNHDYGQLSRINRKHTSTTSRVSAPCFQRFRCHVGFGALLPFHECRLMVCYPCNEGQ